MAYDGGRRDEYEGHQLQNMHAGNTVSSQKPVQDRTQTDGTYSIAVPYATP